MAKGDELDLLLRRIKDDADWFALADAFERRAELPSTMNRRVKQVNFWVRGSSEHDVAQGFTAVGDFFTGGENWYYAPDYSEVLRRVAEELKIKRLPGSIEAAERSILSQVIQASREKIIKEKGVAEWERIEKDARDELERALQAGKITAQEFEQLTGLGAGGMMAALVAGRAAGFGLYILANQIFFGIARTLGLGIGVAVAGPVIGGALAFLLGPGGWLIAGGWLLFDLGRPNWSRCVSSICVLTVIRAKLAGAAEAEL